MSGGLPGAPDAPDAAAPRAAGDADAPFAEPFTLEPAPTASVVPGAPDRGGTRPEPAARLPADRSPSGTTALGVVRDNLEAIAFALILALLLRHLVVEVFKIPTGSMEPTLFGDNSNTRPGTPGDRILVQKDAYLFSAPARWDVVVFDYPLYWPKAFIKRLAVPAQRSRAHRARRPVGGDGPRRGRAHVPPARKPAGVRDVPALPARLPARRPSGGASPRRLLARGRRGTGCARRGGARPARLPRRRPGRRALPRAGAPRLRLRHPRRRPRGLPRPGLGVDRRVPLPRHPRALPRHDHGPGRGRSSPGSRATGGGTCSSSRRRGAGRRARPRRARTATSPRGSSRASPSTSRSRASTATCAPGSTATRSR